MYTEKPAIEELYFHNKRLIGEFFGTKSNPTVVIFAGIHGNEKAGVKAVQRVIEKSWQENLKFRGNVHFILGNINALNKSIRFQDVDLNRIWKREYLDELKKEPRDNIAELRELDDIFSLIQKILQKERGPFYFIDLHTTSAPSVPFITISDSLNNRKFSSNFPIPVVLGIEEYLEGPLLTFINEFGHIALGFEGGSHYAESSVDNCEAFIWKALIHSKCLKQKHLSDFKSYDNVLSDLCCEYQFFEIIYKYRVNSNEEFKMKPGFENFEPINELDALARSDGQEILAPSSGRIFMPLYQNLGEDGFFILKKISKFWLKASIVARRLKINHFLRIIPGVKKDAENNYTLIVDPKVARYLTRPIFHLFGYRQQVLKDDKLHFIKRDRKISEFH